MRFMCRLTISPAEFHAGMDALLSFPVGLVHNPQHAGLFGDSELPTKRAAAWSVGALDRFRPHPPRLPERVRL
jgi:hypothetical protein